MNYVYDGTTGYGGLSGDVFPKTDATPLGSAPANKWVVANDWNTAVQAITDLRSTIRAATWLGFSEQGSDPAPSGYGGSSQPGYLWASSDHKLHYHVNGSDVAIGAATLAQSYGFGSAGPQTITLDSTRLGVIVQDASGPISGTLFGVQTNGGTKLFDVQQNGGGGASIVLGASASSVAINQVISNNTLGITRGTVTSSSSNNTILKLSGDANPASGIANTEQAAVWLVSQTINYQGGGATPATHRHFLVEYPALTFASAQTITNAATLAVSGAPTAGTNCTLTNTYSLWVQGGTTRFDGSVNMGTNRVVNAGDPVSSQDLVTLAYFNAHASGGGSSLSGSGTTNKVTKWTGSTALGNSNITDDGSTISMSVASTSGVVINGTAITSQNTGFTGQSNSILEIQENTSASNDTPYANLALSKNASGSGTTVLGVVSFVNQNAVSSQRQNVAVIGALDGGAQNGKLIINTNNNGTAASALTLDHLQNATFGAAITVPGTAHISGILTSDVNGGLTAAFGKRSSATDNWIRIVGDHNDFDIACISGGTDVLGIADSGVAYLLKLTKAGALSITSTIDRIASGTLTVGGTTATAVQVGRSGQSVGLYGTTPAGQYATTGTTSGFTAGAGSAVDSAATFTGNTGSTAYTVGDVVRCLKLLGAMAA